MSKYYVAGFAFYMFDFVALIEKKRGPAPVIGKLNGVGGHIESSDASAHHAMAREFEEETGIKTEAADWTKFATLNHEPYDAVIHFFQTTLPLNAPALKQTTDERVDWYDVSKIQQLNVVPNLKWLIPMARDNVSATILDSNT
jgi:8-oxo-dGTP diphosphatase